MESIEPRRARETHKQRIDAAMEVLSRLLQEGTSDRRKAVKLLEEVYKERAVQPIRGKAWPEDIWDKEMATLYVIAKYALALNEENPELFHKLFSYEETLEEASELIREKPPEEARKLALFMLGGSINDNTVARMLRIVATTIIMGFASENTIIELLHKLVKVFPEHERTVRKYARYFIALRVAQAIAARLIRSRIEKEAFKQALAARIGLDKIMPDDEYIAFIASTVFEVPRRRLARILSMEEKEGKARGKARRRSAAGS
ncbi:hypothetical protein CF15_04025 [Pyrodictium occultum]|uniref:DUF2192 domain-containing protein n=1 Tax=Pyrodictium occultum TaxID=2309 RepID=A0A0V8RVA1_PYROC|nr:DUF2192 domain-containing protein [Pyrodictium occultum]KSW11968.1 hypothetical protein CF15_04025 [Pyrodictium occultum]